MTQHRPEEPETTAQAKQRVRSRVLAERRRRPAALHDQAAEGLRRALVTELGHTPPGDVAAFLPMAAEPPLTDALEWAHRSGRRIWVPVVESDHAMRWCRWTPSTPLVPGPMRGLREPSGPRHEISVFQSVTLLIVPAVAVGEDGTRLGFGGGYYDRFLEQLAAVHDVPRSLVCVYSSEILPAGELPRDGHDAVISRALTERGIVALAGSRAE